MKLPPKLLEKETKKVSVSVDKQPAVGGNGGIPFSSGCNLSGLKNIRIWQPYFFYNDIEYPSTIKRIWLEFNTPLNYETWEPVYGDYLNLPNDIGDKQQVPSSTLRLNEGDSIIQVDVWTDGIVVNAIQFYMKSGSVSQIFGSPFAKDKSSNGSIRDVKMVTFGGKTSDSKLVGIHGRFGGVIDSLGFAFASEEVSVEEDSSFATEDIDAGFSTAGIGSETQHSEATSWTDVSNEAS